MNTQLIVVLLSYIGIPIEAACIIAFIVYIIGGLLIFGALISIINIGTYTKRTNEQNKEIIKKLKIIQAQNRVIIKNQRKEKEETNKDEYIKYNSTIYDEEE